MTASDLPSHADVLVVGAGPVGLALAMELGLRGVDVVVVEQRERTGVEPRAKTTNVRTMEHMRRWGLAETLRGLAPLPADYPTDVVFSTRLFGYPLATIENAFEGAKRRDPRFPEPAQWIPQYLVEETLQQGLDRLPSVRVLHNHVLDTAIQDDEGVDATIRAGADGGGATIRAGYLIGADGARSRVRELLGIRMQGEHAFAYNYNVVMRVPELGRNPPAQRAIMYWLVNPDSPCVMGPMDSGDRWYFGALLPKDVKELADEDIRRLVNDAVGHPVEIEILTRDLWAAHRLIADGYRVGRMILAGDACHLHPPFGGYGMNLGIADGVDLGWKLAAALRGWGGPGLLDSYERERRPVHVRTIDEAVQNYSVLSAHLLTDSLEDDTPEGDLARSRVGEEIVRTKTREFSTLGVVLGSCYIDSPIIVDDSSVPPVEDSADYEPSAHPGCLAPHAWLDDGSSLYDRFGRDYTLLVMADGFDGASAAFEEAAARIGIPLRVVRVRDLRVRALYEAPMALVRPDQHVAWRGDDGGLNVTELLDTLRGARTALG